MANLVGYEDFRRVARRRLPRRLFDYIDDGTGAQRTVQANRHAFATISFPQPVLNKAKPPEDRSSLFGETLAFPLVLAPVGFAGMYNRGGEVAAARAAQASGVPFTLSTVSKHSIETVARAAHGGVWFQLYLGWDRAYSFDLLDRAWSCGVRTLVFTVDTNTIAKRRSESRRTSPSASLGQAIEEGAQLLRRPGWLWSVGLRARPHVFGNFVAAAPEARSFKDMIAAGVTRIETSLGWSDVAAIRDRWQGTLIVKGIMEAADASHAVAAGADGIWVSNHGGRQLDGAPATLSALPDIAAAVAGKVPVLIDGGVRTGHDILAAIALGADAAVVGRPWAYALAANGEAGVAAMIRQMRDELNEAMVLSGCHNLQDARNLSLKPSLPIRPIAPID